MPLGSILGSLLFSLYTSVLTASVSFWDYHLHADDTQIIYFFNKNEVDYIYDRINNDLHEFATSSKKHAVVINILIY